MVRSATVEFIEARPRTTWVGHDCAYPARFPPENESYSHVSMWKCKSCDYVFFVRGDRSESAKKASSVKNKRKLAACSCG
jgi:hypothetical protein